MAEISTHAQAVAELKRLGYTLPQIRRALSILSGINQPEIARRIGCKRSTVTLTVNGHRRNKALQYAIAQIWQVPAEELFSDIP